MIEKDKKIIKWTDMVSMLIPAGTNWIWHIVKRNCLILDAIEEKLERKPILKGKETKFFFLKGNQNLERKDDLKRAAERQPKIAGA